MSLQNYSFDKDNNSLSLVTFTSPDGGGGYEDKCGVVWDSVNNTWKEINGQYYMFQQVALARFDLGASYQNLVKFEAGQDFTFETLFIIDDKGKPREISVNPSFALFQYAKFDTDSWYWGETAFALYLGNFCEDGTNHWDGLSYEYATQSVISGSELSKVYKRGCLNHYACVRYNGVISIYANGIKIATLNYNRKLYNSTGGAGIHRVLSNGSYVAQNPIIGIYQYHISNTARYTNNFTYIPKIIYQYDDSILKVY